MRRTRAFVLVLVLFCIVILFTMGFGFLGSRVGQYRSTHQSGLAAQARALARAGLEDARAKINKDISFPPPLMAGSSFFCYSEDLTDSSGSYLGSYKVSIDSAGLVSTPTYLSITSMGGAGGASPAARPVATHSYRVYFDMAVASPTYFQILRFDDLGSPTWGAVSGGGP